MRRGDLVRVALQGDAGKPRPALIIQSDAIDASVMVLVVPFTSVLTGAPVRRYAVAASPDNGLLAVSELMLDRLTFARREILTSPFGRLTSGQMADIGTQLAIIIGLADTLSA